MAGRPSDENRLNLKKMKRGDDDKSPLGALFGHQRPFSQSVLRFKADASTGTPDGYTTFSGETVFASICELLADQSACRYGARLVDGLAGWQEARLHPHA